jgi:hypothetical protein
MSFSLYPKRQPIQIRCFERRDWMNERGNVGPMGLPPASDAPTQGCSCQADLYSGTFVMAPDYARVKTVALTRDVAVTYAPLDIAVAYAGQTPVPKPFLMIVGVPPGSRRNRLGRGPKRGDRISLGGGSILIACRRLQPIWFDSTLP